MSATESPILTEQKDTILTITLNRPKVNAFNLEMTDALQEVLKKAQREARIRAVILTASGNVFSAGQDITEVKEAEDTSFRYHLQHTYNPLILQIRRLEKPVLAAINGAVSGAALGIVLACDLRIAAEHARFVVGFSGIGLAPDSAVSLLLPVLVGLGRAAEFTYANTPISAEQALSVGMVNQVVPASEVLNKATEWAARLAQGSQLAFGLTKRAFNRAVLGNLEQVLDYEAHLQDIAGHSEAHKEGVRAFLEKRTPRFIDYS
ncbi:MAG: enoyl-CoA hydratase/isomerase family protein [Anaerolineales bacterium]|nr:MAG: enoyl-CoA hydratase/isomerase family protein [Anaerolineales bacterium]